MAKFGLELPDDILKDVAALDVSAERMMGEMCQAGSTIVLAGVKSALAGSFATTRSLLQGLKVTRVYKTPSDDGINVKIGFWGYSRFHKNKTYPDGVPIDLIANAREYGTSRGEAPRPFFRRQFRQKAAIEAAMQSVQDRYLPKG